MDLKSEETKQRLNVDLSCQCQILISIYFISPSCTGNLYKKSDLLNKYRDLLRYMILWYSFLAWRYHWPRWLPWPWPAWVLCYPPWWASSLSGQAAHTEAAWPRYLPVLTKHSAGGTEDRRQRTDDIGLTGMLGNVLRRQTVSKRNEGRCRRALYREHPGERMNDIVSLYKHLTSGDWTATLQGTLITRKKRDDLSYWIETETQPS